MGCCLPTGRAQTPACPREGGMQDEPVALFANLYSLLSLPHKVPGAPWYRHCRGPHALPSTGGCDIAHHLPMACCKGGVCSEEGRSEASDLEQRSMAQSCIHSSLISQACQQQPGSSSHTAGWTWDERSCSPCCDSVVALDGRTETHACCATWPSVYECKSALCTGDI